MAIPTDFSEAETVSPEPNPTFTTEVLSPPSVAIDPVTTFTGTTAHFSGTIDPEAPAGNPSEFDVSWRFECVPACPNVQGGTIPADSDSHTVEADAAGLEPNTSYEVTLVAENIGSQQSAGPESFETDPVAPGAQTLYAGQIGEAGAVLAARVNPKNSPTSYQFEWGTDASYGNVTPAAAQTLGAEDNAFHVVTAPVSGLSSGATYHFRVVATNSETSEQTAGEDHAFATPAPSPPAESCPNAQLREENNSEALPDCRAYEMVSPLDKNGGDVERDYVGNKASISGASELGDAVAYPSQTSFGDEVDSGAVFATMRSVRTSTGWTTSAIQPPYDAYGFGGRWPNVAYLSPDLTKAAVLTTEPLTPAAADLGGAFGLYVRDAVGTPRYRLVSDPASPLALTLDYWLEFAAATPDMSHVVFNTGIPLLPDAPD
ncbi:MAG TPA: hypothetical protein VF030_08090, partial [Solirubrobacterales bacterium]